MCQNPLKSCNRKDLHVIIVYKGEKREICKKCWEEIADSDLEWGESGGDPREKIPRNKSEDTKSGEQ